MEQTTQLGMNKTGIDMSPLQSKKMIEGAESFPVLLGEGYESHTPLERFYNDETDSLGSVPIPMSMKGIVKSALKTMTGHHPEVFVNKLGERLAYERSGVRIYEHLILKCKRRTNYTQDINIPIDLLEQFRNEEAEHFEILAQCLKSLGADPTAQTPDADASAVASSGLMKVIVDPRTSISQSLQAMLAIEYADNAAWELLVKLAGDMNLPDMVFQFQKALRQEDKHLEYVKMWYEERVLSQAKASH